MNKELSPLEALNEMINKFVEILLEIKCENPTAVKISYLNNTLQLAFHDKLDIIENALKRLEKYDSTLKEYGCDSCDLDYFLSRIFTKLEQTGIALDKLKECATVSEELATFGNKVCPKNCIGNCEECELVAKKIKALEIIKELILKDLVFDDKEQEINFSFGISTLCIKIKDKQKYDLLKEVLL